MKANSKGYVLSSLRTFLTSVTLCIPVALLAFGTTVMAVAPVAPTLSGEARYEENDLSWTDSDTTITGYTLQRNGTTIYSGTAISYNDMGRSTGATDNYVVIATNSDGTTSSNTLSITSPADTGVTTRDVNLIGLGIAILIAFFTVRAFRFRGDV